MDGLWDNLGRVSGPMWVRFLIQPAVAAVLGVRAGLRDVRLGRPPYLWTIFHDASARHELLREGWKDIAKVFVMAAVMDAIYQLAVFRWIYVGEMLIVACLLAAVPYLLIRGPVNRVRRRRGRA